MRYLPRLVTVRTIRPSSAAGSHPSGQRRGFPRYTPLTLAPAMRSEKLRRVTSTSGNSGMAFQHSQMVWNAIRVLDSHPLSATNLPLSSSDEYPEQHPHTPSG